MKVMHIITGLGGGGAEGFLVRLLKATRKEHSPVVVSLLKGGIHAEAISAMGIQVHELGLTRGGLNPFGLSRLISLVRREKPDILVSWMYHANLLASLAVLPFARLPLIWTVHHANLDPLFNKRRTLQIARWCAWFSRRCAAVVYVGANSRSAHERIGYRADRGLVIPIGVASDVFRPDAGLRSRCRSEWGVGEGRMVFGLVARLDPLKNQAGFLRAAGSVAKDFPDTRFVLAGEGVDSGNAWLREVAEEHGVGGQAIFLGRRADVEALYNGMDVVVLSSLGESFPTVLCEALCCGKPCVTTDVGDAAAIVGPHGMVVPPGDDAALADAMLRMARQFYSGDMACPGIRERAAGLFDMKQAARQYSALFGSVVTGRAEP